MTITVNSPTAAANTPFTVSGALSGYVITPTLTYADNPVLAPVGGLKMVSATANSVTLSWNADSPIVWNPLPAGASVSATSFSFTHPGRPLGAAVIDVSDGKVAGSAKYTVGEVVPGITHATVIAKLTALKATIDGIISDVSTLTP